MVFIGLLSRRSLQSTYVLFELGARWGAGSPFTPLVAAGLPMSELRAPLAGLHAHSCDVETDLEQMLDETGERLGLQKISRGVYDAHLRRLSERSKTEGAKRLAPGTQAPLGEEETKKSDLIRRALASLKALRSNLPRGYFQPNEYEYVETFKRALSRLNQAGCDVQEWALPNSAGDDVDDSMLRSKIDAVLLYFEDPES